MTAPDPPEAPGAPARSRPVVRLAEAPDLPAVCEIVNHYIEHTAVNFRTAPQTPAEWRELWRERRDRYPWYVAEVAGEPVGIAYAGPWNPRAAYAWTAESTIYLAPDHHGRGLGGEGDHGRQQPEAQHEGCHGPRGALEPEVVGPARGDQHQVDGARHPPAGEGERHDRDQGQAAGDPDGPFARVTGDDRLVRAADLAVAGRVDQVVGPADGELAGEHGQSDERQPCRRELEGDAQEEGEDDYGRAKRYIVETICDGLDAHPDGTPA